MRQLNESNCDGAAEHFDQLLESMSNAWDAFIGKLNKHADLPVRPVVWNEANHRLAAYGTLRPNQSNYSVVADITGVWVPGNVIGNVVERHGYPVLTWNERGTEIPVEILVSEKLPEHWSRVDAFEGIEYQRILIPVQTADSTLICYLYNERTNHKMHSPTST